MSIRDAPRGLLIKKARSHKELEESQKSKSGKRVEFRGAGSSQVPRVQ